jgi:hypothetical protein
MLLFHDFAMMLILAVAVVMAVQAWHMARAAHSLVRLFTVLEGPVTEVPRAINGPEDLNGTTGLT